MNFFKKASLFWVIVTILILPGILVAILKCSRRYEAESKNIYVETVADLDEFRLLARRDGWTLEELFAKLKESGISSVGISEDTLASLELEGKINILSSNEMRKFYEMTPSVQEDALAGLFIHSDDVKLLDRINQNLSWKLEDRNLQRMSPNMLLIKKSGNGILDKIGLGFSEECFEMAEMFKLGIVTRVYNYPGLSKETAAKIINSLPTPASVSALMFADEEMLGERGDLDNIIELFKKRSYRIAWVEFDVQEGIQKYIKALKNNSFVRIHSIPRKELDLIYTPEKATARWLRAVKDRSLKMLYFRCFLKDEKKYIPNWTEFNLNYIKNTVDEIKKAGFLIAYGEKRFEEPRLKIGEITTIEALSLCIALVLGLAILLKLSFVKDLNSHIVMFFPFITMFLYLIFPRGFPLIASIIGAITYSSIGFVWATESIDKDRDGFVKNSFKFIFFLILPSILGGIFIASLYSTPLYMLKFEQFRGVKISFIVPLIFTLVWTIKKYGSTVLDLLKKPLTVINFLILSVVVVCLVFYILRSDNTTLVRPTIIEEQTRIFLENTLVARPRNKEFLVGYPAAMLFVLLLMRKELVILPILAIFIQMGQVSVLNTFCHFHTRLSITLVRVFNGFWLGVLIGIILVMALRFIQLLIAYWKKKQKRVFLIGYFGFGNVGDELLRGIFSDKLLQKFNNYEISVLSNNQILNNRGNEERFIHRSDLIAIVEELIKCEAVVVPGGGVFQSITSWRSLLYYFFIIRLARLFKAKVVLPAQGLGPWNNKGFFVEWLHRQLAKELKRADYISVRDNASLERYQEITSQFDTVDLTTDLAFLNDSFLKKKPKGRIEFMRIYAILRTSVKGSSRIASELIKLVKDSENINLVPVAFQADEDVDVWKKAGWEGDIKIVGNIENALNDADLVISMRLHGCIIASIMGIPWIGLSYDPKVASFAEACEWSDFCCNPIDANAEFFENSINKLAFYYMTYSRKLLIFADKMNRVAVKDFEKASDAISKVISVVFVFLLINMSVFAQSSFPSWMDEVDFNRKSTNISFDGPIDPETGKTSTLDVKRSKNFKPKLPDFAELRKKSTKVEMDTSSNTVTLVDNNTNQCIQNLKDIPELATATNLIEAVSRLASETSSAFPLNNEKDEEQASRERYLKQNNYRPGRIKSFYLETMKERRKKEEEQNNGGI